MFLTLLEKEFGATTAQVHFVRPREVRKAHVFKVLIHLDVVEDLLFYHHPREELVADGKVPWRELSWQSSKLEGEVDEDDFAPVPWSCQQNTSHPWHPRDEDDDDRDQKRPRERSLLHRMSSWMDNRGRSKNMQSKRYRGGSWFVGESSHGCRRAQIEMSPSPMHGSSSSGEKRALRDLWKEKGASPVSWERLSPASAHLPDSDLNGDVTTIIPQAPPQPLEVFSQTMQVKGDRSCATDAIIIIPQPPEVLQEMLKFFPQTQPNRDCTRLDQNSVTSFSDHFDHGKEP
jgi:hypothetical protein